MSSIDSRILKEKDETEGKDNHIQREAKSILKSPKEKKNQSTSCTWYYRIKATTKVDSSPQQSQHSKCQQKYTVQMRYCIKCIWHI